MRKFNKLCALALCTAVVSAFTFGCGKKEEGEIDILKEVDEMTQGERVSAEIGSEAAASDNSFICTVTRIYEAGYYYENSKMAAAELTVTNNTDEDCYPNYLTYFSLRQDGELISSMTTRVQVVAAKSDIPSFFPDGIKAGETASSTIYFEIPNEFDELQLEFCPGTMNAEGVAELNLLCTFTPDDVEPVPEGVETEVYTQGETETETE